MWDYNSNVFRFHDSISQTFSNLSPYDWMFANKYVQTYSWYGSIKYDKHECKQKCLFLLVQILLTRMKDKTGATH